MLKQTISILLIFCLLNSSVFAAGDVADNSTPQIIRATPQDSAILEEKGILDNRALNSHLSGQIIKRLGEPGYYFSKYLNYRRQISAPACYTSQQINKASIIIALVGEVTIHAFDYFEARKLKKKYESQLAEINDYRKKLNAEGKKLLEYDSKNPDAQIASLKYLRSAAEIELKRAELNRKIVYVTLGLQISSQIMAGLETAAESATGGSLLAKNEVCFNAKVAQQKEEEAKTAKLLSGEETTKPSQALTDYSKREDVPWYYRPFQWIAGGLGVIEDSDFFQEYKNLRRGVNKETRIREGSTAGITDGKLYMEVSESAGYAEEMLVDVVLDVVRKWQNGRSKLSMQDEINGVEEKGSSGIVKIIKTFGLDEVALRYGIRALIKTNMIAVNTFLRSPGGKLTIYAYNVYVTKRTIDITEAQVEYGKQKIALIDKSIAEFEAKTKTTWSPILLHLIDAVMPAKANAAIAKNYIFPNPPCMRDISPKCDGNLKDFLLTDDNGVFKYYPKDVQVAQQNFLTGSYSLKTALSLSTGKYSIENIDVEKVKAEIKKLELINQKLEQTVLKGKVDLAQKDQIMKSFKADEQFFPAKMLAASVTADPDIAMVPALASINPSAPVEAAVVKSNTPGTTSVSSDLSTQSEVAHINEKNVNYDMGDSNIYKKEIDLFEVISHRYDQIFNR